MESNHLTRQAKFSLFRFKDFEINILYTKDKGKREQHTQAFYFSKHFSSTCKLQQKLDLELSYKTQSLHVLFFFFVFETPLKDFPFYSSIHLTLWSKYHRKTYKGKLHVSFQSTFLQNSPQNSKIPRKSQENAFYSNLKT